MLRRVPEGTEGSGYEFPNGDLDLEVSTPVDDLSQIAAALSAMKGAWLAYRKLFISDEEHPNTATIAVEIPGFEGKEGQTGWTRLTRANIPASVAIGESMELSFIEAGWVPYPGWTVLLHYNDRNVKPIGSGAV
jgi:hypothetical protein